MLRHDIDGFRYVAISLRSGTKGGCRHVSTLTLMSVMKLKRVCRRFCVSEAYLEGEVSSPLYRSALSMTVSRLCEV